MALRHSFTTSEIDWLTSSCDEQDEDRCIEELVDSIRDCECMFAFKEPLRSGFYGIKGHARNCLEIPFPITPRKIGDWLTNCIKCYDCILLVYLQDVLGEYPKNSGPITGERDVYYAYEALPDEELKEVGELHNYIYQIRNKLTHVQKETKSGRRELCEISNKKKKQYFYTVFKMLRKSSETMVNKYRSKFPEHCTDSSSLRKD